MLHDVRTKRAIHVLQRCLLAIARTIHHFGFFGGARIVLYNLPTFLATSADFNAFLAAVTPFFAVLAVFEMTGPLYGSISARSSNTRTV